MSLKNIMQVLRITVIIAVMNGIVKMYMLVIHIYVMMVLYQVGHVGMSMIIKWNMLILTALIVENINNYII